MGIKQEDSTMAASREKVLYFEPQPSEQTAALKTVFVRMGVRIKNVEAVSAGQTVGFLLNRKGFEPTDETADASDGSRKCRRSPARSRYSSARRRYRCVSAVYL